jgi:hypothetical protein
VRSLDKNNVDRFFNSDDGIVEYIKKHFQDTNKLVSITSNISEDFSTQTKILIFKSQEDYDNFASDKILQYQNVLRDRYNTYHNIKLEQNITTI